MFETWIERWMRLVSSRTLASSALEKSRVEADCSVRAWGASPPPPHWLLHIIIMFLNPEYAEAGGRKYIRVSREILVRKKAK